MKKSKNSNDAVALALAGGGFLAHSDLERNGLAWLFNFIFYLICHDMPTGSLLVSRRKEEGDFS